MAAKLDIRDSPLIQARALKAADRSSERLMIMFTQLRTFDVAVGILNDSFRLENGEVIEEPLAGTDTLERSSRTSTTAKLTAASILQFSGNAMFSSRFRSLRGLARDSDLQLPQCQKSYANHRHRCDHHLEAKAVSLSSETHTLCHSRHDPTASFHRVLVRKEC